MADEVAEEDEATALPMFKSDDEAIEFDEVDEDEVESFDEDSAPPSALVAAVVGAAANRISKKELEEEDEDDEEDDDDAES